MKKILLFLILLIPSLMLFSSPNMNKAGKLEIEIKNSKIKVNDILYSEKITIADWEKYLKKTNVGDIESFEKRLRYLSEDNEKIIEEKQPVFGNSWLEVIRFCNWLSEEENLIPCYIEYYTDVRNIKIDYNANGYRLPFVLELLCLEKNSYISDETDISMFPEYCNDFWKEDFSLDKLKEFPNGPETFTPDEDEIFYHEKLNEIRTALANENIEPINIICTNDAFYSFRVVRRVANDFL